MGALPALELGEVLTAPRRKQIVVFRNVHNCLGLGLILRYDLSNGKGHEIW